MAARTVPTSTPGAGMGFGLFSDEESVQERIDGAGTGSATGNAYVGQDVGAGTDGHVDDDHPEPETSDITPTTAYALGCGLRIPEEVLDQVLEI